MTTPNPKCSRCKCYWIPDDTDIKSSGLISKSCKKCRENQKLLREKWKSDTSKCSRCGKILDPNETDKCTICIEGSIKYKKKYYDDIDNRIKKNEYQKTYRLKNPEQRKKWKEENKERIREYNKEYIKIYRENISLPLYLVHLQRTHLRRLLSKTDVVKKTKPSIEYLGCSAEYFIEHIEKQFKDGMTWDNIHLDHIKPVSKFDLDDEEEFLLCCNYKNFQPLLAKDNLEKYNRFTEEDEIKWKKLMEIEE